MRMPGFSDHIQDVKHAYRKETHGEGGEIRCGFGMAMRSVVVSCGIRIHGLTLSGGGVGVGQPFRRLTYETYEKEVYEIYERGIFMP